MKGSGGVAEWLQIAFRAFGAIIALFVLTRILGKKQISQLTFFEYITGITIGDLAGFISTDVEANYGHGLVAIMVWFLVPYTVEWLSVKSRLIGVFFQGKETVIIKDGKILEDNLKKERFTTDELLEQLRVKNVFKVADVEFALLETSGQLSVLLKPENQPVTPRTLGIKLPAERQPIVVVMEGKLLDEGLSQSGFSREWLLTELEKIGVAVSNVFIGQVDAYGQLFVDLFDDAVQVPMPSGKSLLFATIKKCQADLELFANITRNETARMMFAKSAVQMDKVVDEMKSVLTRM